MAHSPHIQISSSCPIDARLSTPASAPTCGRQVLDTVAQLTGIDVDQPAARRVVHAEHDPARWCATRSRAAGRPAHSDCHVGSGRVLSSRFQVAATRYRSIRARCPRGQRSARVAPGSVVPAASASATPNGSATGRTSARGPRVAGRRNATNSRRLSLRLRAARSPPGRPLLPRWHRALPSVGRRRVARVTASLLVARGRVVHRVVKARRRNLALLTGERSTHIVGDFLAASSRKRTRSGASPPARDVDATPATQHEHGWLARRRSAGGQSAAGQLTGALTDALRRGDGRALWACRKSRATRPPRRGQAPGSQDPAEHQAAIAAAEAERIG